MPAGIYLVAILCMVAWRDRDLSRLFAPAFEAPAFLLRVSPDRLYTFAILFVGPLCFLLLARQRPRDYGLTLGRVRVALPVFVVLLVGCTGVALSAGRLESMAAFYRGVPNIHPDAFVLLGYLFAFWGWEFITRGFLLLGLKRYVGIHAVYIQLLPFVILHLGKPAFELYGSIVFGLLFGYYAYLAYLVDSFVYCAFLHAWFAFVLDLSVALG